MTDCQLFKWYYICPRLVGRQELTPAKGWDPRQIKIGAPNPT